MPTAKKLIEVALPLDAINRASAREKSIRHGHPSTLHLWWARRPLAAARAVIFTSLVDDPDDPDALPEFVAACQALPGDGPNVKREGDTPRMRLFDFIERLVTWEATTDESIMGEARKLIRIATKGEPPPLLDPFAGGGSIPLEAQRLGLEAHASDLNPVAVMINKAMIEIPPRFADMPPVNPRDQKSIFGHRGTEAQRKDSVGASLGSPAGRRDSRPVDSGRGDPVGRPQWKGAAGLAADVRYYGEWMRERAYERIGHLYPKHKGETVIAWLWARTVTSPNPAVNAPVPLVRSFVLSKKKGRECWAKPKVEGTTVRFEVTPGKPPAGEDGTVKRTGARCIISGEPMGFDYVRAEGKAGRMGAQLMAIVTEGKRGRSYYSPDAEHARIAESAEPKWKPVGDVPEQALGFRVQLYGMDEYHKLFTPRQLTALTTFSDLVHEARELVTRDALASTPLGPPNELGGGLNVEDDRPLREGGQGARAYGEALQAYLGMALSRVVMGCNSLSRWNSFGQKVQHCFGRQALPMIWDFADPNPFTESTGSWSSGFKYVADPLERGGISPQARATVFQEDATALRIADKLLLSTDPPYYDNIGYADLSDMFYVWMRRTIREVYPDLFSTMLTPKSSELIASAHRHESKECATTSFEDGMRWTLQQARGLVVLDYPATVYYAFKQQDIGSNGSGASSGWETMLASLISGGFSIVGSWPIRTEMRTRLVGRGTNALASSIVLVCRPRPEDAPAISRRRFLDALRAELPGAIAEMKTGSIAPVDMAQATIGPGMAIFSRYSQVLEADGAPLTVRMALGLINAALDEVLEGAVTELDAETRFAVSWFEQYAFEKGDFGGANTIAQGKNTAVDSVERAGLVEATGGQVRLINWREYDPGAYEPEQDKRPTVWEGAHHLIERLNHHGEMGAAALYNRLPGDIAESARDLAYRLYHICDRKGWAEDALDYNVLVSSWSEITRLAASGRNRGDQADMFDDS